jgi:hypothetical protein
VVGAQVRVLDHLVADAEPGKRSDRGAFLATAALARQGRTFLLQNPLYAFEPQVTVAKIVAMDRDGKLPSLDGHGWDRGDELTVVGRLNLLVAPTSLVPDAGAVPVRLGTVRRATVAEVPGRPDCRRIDARDRAEVTLLGTGPSSLRVRGDGPIGLFLRDARSAAGEPVSFTLDPEADLVLSIGRIDGVLVASLPPGATTLCGFA